MKYIELNISQIARMFNLSASALANQLRKHYPDVLSRREKERNRLGLSTSLQYGARKWSKEAYVSAVELLQTSDMTIKEVAQVCNVSYSGLRDYILSYHPRITQDREEKRHKAKEQKLVGQRNGSWSMHMPNQCSVEKYEKAIELYKTTSMDVEEIASLAGVSLGGFRYHLRTWHPELMVQRRGFDESVNIEQTKRYKRSTAEKYAKAIERLKHTDTPLSQIVGDLKLSMQSLRMYIKEHCPELLEVYGMVKISNGKVVYSRTADKYAEALKIYESSSETLKSIAQRLGLSYNSLGGYIRRNYPEKVEKHNSLQLSPEERFREGILKLMNSNATINSVIEEFGYGEYFRAYVKAKHPELLTRDTVRKKYNGTKVAAQKYAKAIEKMRSTRCTMKSIAQEYGLRIDSFRHYLYRHAPDVLRHRKTSKKL